MLLNRKTNDSNCFILISFRILEKKGAVNHCFLSFFNQLAFKRVYLR